VLRWRHWAVEGIGVIRTRYFSEMLVVEFVIFAPAAFTWPLTGVEICFLLGRKAVFRRRSSAFLVMEAQRGTDVGRRGQLTDEDYSGPLTSAREGVRITLAPPCGRQVRSVDRTPNYAGVAHDCDAVPALFRRGVHPKRLCVGDLLPR
jgi:hypothetical protein